MANRPSRLRVFHGLVNFGTQAELFARCLRKNGIDSLSVTYPDRFKRLIDIELAHGGNFFQKLVKHAWNWIRRFYWFFHYNTFHFYYGTSLFPKQLDLPLYHLFGKRVLMHYVGNDVQGYRRTVEKYKWSNMPGYIGEADPDKYDRAILKRLAFESKFLDLQIVGGPYLSEFVENSIVVPIAIDIESYEYSEPPHNKIVNIAHAPSHRGFKGTEYIISAIQRLISEGYVIDFNLLENLPHHKVKEGMIKADLFIDQIMAGWYGAASIEAMALGRPVICSIRASYYEYIDYGHKIPIINADPDCVYDVIKNLLDNMEKLPELGRLSRQFVEEVHNVNSLTEKLFIYYKQIWSANR